MNWRAYSVMAYGVLIFIGGLIGYMKADSSASLFMGSISAVIALVSGRAMLQDRAAGGVGALLLSAILLIFFGSRFLDSGKFMPAGLMVICSIAILVIVSMGYKKNDGNEKEI